jgi:uncharacterized 2Fe-2S/4Fe-4S cluster protein (DUF4445 family)
MNNPVDNMPKSKIKFLPADIKVDVDPGSTISEAALKASLDLRQGCFGKHLCGRCRITVVDGIVPDATDADKKILSPLELKKGIRLGCKTEVAGDMVVKIPEAGRTDGLALEKPFLLKDWQVEPYLYILPLDISPPSLSDNIADFDRIIRFLREKKDLEEINIKPEFLNHLSETLRDSNWKVGAVLIENPEVAGHLSILDVVQITSPKIPQLYSVALDIGTTTIAGYLLDQNSGKLTASYSLPNPQARFGADVISRLNFCKTKGAKGISMLQKAASLGIRDLVGHLIQSARINFNSIYSIVSVGNSVMQHLILGLDPRGLAEAPYSMVSTSYPSIDACALDISEIDSCPHRISLINLPGVAGYFGADAVACALVAGTTFEAGKGEAAVVIDIGTNGEILLLTPDDRILGCSTAAGPAFEGGHISYGTPPVVGAVSNLRFGDNAIEFDIIGDENQPQGLTGAAIIDLTAGLVENGLVNLKGNLIANGNFADRIRKSSSGQPEFIVSETAESDDKMTFNQEDVRQVQLAKGAICGGIKTLISQADVKPEQIIKVYLAGAFGSYASPESVRKIGMVPELPGAEIVSLGNAAGAGAVMAAVSRSDFNKFYEIAKKIEYIELATDKQFNQFFIDSMHF